ATSDGYGDTGFDTKCHSFVEESALLPGPLRLWRATIPTKELALIARPSHDGVNLLIAKLEIPVGPGSRVRGHQPRHIVGQTQIGKPSKAKTLCNSPCDSSEADLIVGSLKCVGKFLKRILC